MTSVSALQSRLASPASVSLEARSIEQSRTSRGLLRGRGTTVPLEHSSSSTATPTNAVDVSPSSSLASTVSA